MKFNLIPLFKMKQNQISAEDLIFEANLEIKKGRQKIRRALKDVFFDDFKNIEANYNMGLLHFEEYLTQVKDLIQSTTSNLKAYDVFLMDDSDIG